MEGDTIKILLIESDVRLGELTARYLRTHGFAVVIQRGGQREETLHAFRCIVVGLLGTSRDGIDVARELRELTEVPVVASWVLRIEDREPRPLSASELLERIRSAVGIT